MNLIVTYADMYGGAKNQYAVVDTIEKKIIFQEPSKSAVIQKAQELKKWSPVDGSEQTYAEQIIAYGGER